MSRHKPVKTARPIERRMLLCGQCGARAGVEVWSATWVAFYCLAHYEPDTLSDAMRLDLCKCVIHARGSDTPIALKTGKALERRALVEATKTIGGWRPTDVGRSLVDGWEKSKTLGLENAALFDKRFAQKGDLR